MVDFFQKSEAARLKIGGKDLVDWETVIDDLGM
jgi:hypothetical protein